MKKTYAVISDIHGNLLALLAVLKNIHARQIETIINLGDHFFGALEPEGVAQLLRENPMHSIRGNTDREILESLGTVSQKDQMERVKSELSAQSISFLKQLPLTLTVDDLIFACHGIPDNDNEYLLEKVTAKGVFVYNDEELIAKTSGIEQRIILCGHSHVSRVVYLSNNKMILNPGSVGLPAYLGNGAHRFAMESMTPHAKYAIIHADGPAISIEQVHCAYDWNKASAAAKSNGSDAWAGFLLHGRMPKSLR